MLRGLEKSISRNTKNKQKSNRVKTSYVPQKNDYEAESSCPHQRLITDNGLGAKKLISSYSHCFETYHWCYLSDAIHTSLLSILSLVLGTIFHISLDFQFLALTPLMICVHNFCLHLIPERFDFPNFIHFIC